MESLDPSAELQVVHLLLFEIIECCQCYMSIKKMDFATILHAFIFWLSDPHMVVSREDELEQNQEWLTNWK